MNLKSFLSDYISCKSVSSDSNLESGMADARRHVIKFLEKLQLDVREVKSGRHAAIFAKSEQKSDRPTVLVYGHYDVQPADDAELWDSDPFVLSERNGRLYARGISDNKGCHSVILAAIHDLTAGAKNLPINLKFVLEGEEEIGSCGMEKFLFQMKDELSADFALVADTWSLDEKNIVITTALRGIVGLELEVCGPERDLHSGYGGCVLNPIQALTDICSALHDRDGRVNVPGFYDDVAMPSDWDREQVARLPMGDEALGRILGVKRFKVPDPEFSAAETMRFLPTLEFNGITGGFQGEGIKTVIPRRASVKITCRLVHNQRAEKIQALLEKTLANLCPAEVSLSTKFDHSANPYLFDVKNVTNKTLKNAIKLVNDGVKTVFGNVPIFLREGGSIGLVTMLKEILGIDSLLIGLSTSEDNCHGPNESIAISMLEKGREFFRLFFSGL
ncbi:MAG: M20/M25/M40 family metallo-hydrolase [Puniceicoccales bacterium]|nr:M20/M25/M40 family metallo-hydrolase [Puniceicoccales bacterium]